MAVVDQAGISPTDLAGYVERLEALLRDALGADLDLAPETPQGQLAGLFGLLLAEIDEGLVNVANGMSHHTAAGSQLDDWGSLLGIPRITGERSTVTATLSGAAGTVVPAGSRVETTQGAIFRVDTDVVIGTSDSVDALMRSAEAGPIVAEAGTLTRLVDIFSGWTGVTNAEDAALGRADESDADYRARYRSTVAHRSGSGLEAIRARVLQVDGVTRAAVHDNATAAAVTLQDVTIPARSLIVIAEGGADADIGQAIRDTKPAGIPSTGTQSVTVEGVAHRFERVEVLAVRLDLIIAIDIETFPADGPDEIPRRVVAWAEGLWSSGAGDFDLGGLDIGESLDERRVLSPISSVPGHRVTYFRATIKSDDADVPSSIGLNQRLSITAEDVMLNLAAVPSFADEVTAQAWAQNTDVSLTLPEALDGNAPLTYSLAPDLPAGLNFDADTRTVSGSATEALAQTEFTYTVTDLDGDTSALTFSVTVT